MRDHMSECSDGRGRGTRLVPSAAVAVSTFALALPLTLPAIARAHTSGRLGAGPHPIALHAAKFSSHGHQVSRSYPADLTACSTSTEFSVQPLSAVSTIRPHERLTPTASARGPPEAAENP